MTFWDDKRIGTVQRELRISPCRGVAVCGVRRDIIRYLEGIVPVIHRFVKAIFNVDEITVFGDGMQSRDFTFVDDAVDANILVAESDIVGEVFNIGGGSRISVSELIKLIEDTVGKKANIKNIEKQKGDVRDTLADVIKAKKELGWNPKININKGLRKYIEWYSLGVEYDDK